MSTKWHIVIISTAILFLVALVIIFSLTSKSNLEIPFNPSNLEECNTLVYNSDSAINMVFFGSEQETQEYVDFFYQTQPYKNHKEKFNFYYIDSYEPNCELYKNIAILCYTRENLEKAASCPHDFIIVLQDAERELRSSAYVNLVSINTKHAKTVQTHEFGHIIANLAEEYTPANLPKGQKNCGETCSLFGGLENGCFEGCSKSNMIRSIENGVMRTLRSNDYGTYDNKLVNDFITENIKRIKSGKAVLAPYKSPQGSPAPSPLTGEVIHEPPINCEDQNAILVTGDGEIIQIPGCAPNLDVSVNPELAPPTGRIEIKKGGKVVAVKYVVNTFSTVGSAENDDGSILDGEIFPGDDIKTPIIFPASIDGEELTFNGVSYLISTLGATACPI